MASANPDRHARWWPPLALVAVIVVVVLGGYVFTGALAAAQAQEPVTVGDTVRLFPLSEWEQAASGDVGGTPALRLTRGTGSLDTFAPLTPDAPDALLRNYVTQVLQPGAERLDVSEQIERFELPYGTAVRASYVGLFGDRQTWIEGEVTVVVTPDGRGILYDGWGPQGLFGYSLDDIETMISAAEAV